MSRFLSKLVENTFFNGNSQNYWQPYHYGLKHREFSVKNIRGDEIQAQVLLPNSITSNHIIIFFHSAQFNMSFNLPQVAFLTQNGIPVIMFDYSGCGRSSGENSLDSLVHDARSVLEWLEDQAEYKNFKIIFFGQGLGCDAALQLYNEYSEKVSGLVLESPYYNRKHWLIDKWGPLIGHIGSSLLKTKATEPSEILPTIKTSLLVIYPENDQFIHRSEKKFVLNHLPTRAFVWEVPQCKYLGIFGTNQIQWQNKLLNFIRKKCI